MNDEDIDDPMEIDDTVPNDSLIIERLDSSCNTSQPENIYTEGPQDNQPNVENELKNDDLGTNDFKHDESVKVNDEVVLLEEEELKDGTPTKVLDVTVSSDVIDLVDIISSKCINYACKSGKDIMEAPGFCLSYYRVKSEANKKKEVCLECYHMAVSDYDKLVTEFKAGNVLFKVDVPLRNDMVEIEDSDEEVEEMEEDTDYLDDESAEFISTEIDAAFDRVFSNHNIKTQMQKEIHHIKQKSQNLCAQMKEVDANYKYIRSTLDSLQINLYNHFRPELRELKGVNIIDDRSLNNGTLLTTASLEKFGPAPNNKPVIRYSNNNVPRIQGKPPQSTAAPKSVASATASKTVQSESIQVRPPADLPKVGPILKPAMIIGETYYVMRITGTGPWVRARLVQTLPVDFQGSKCTTYKLFELKQLKERQVNGKQIAYSTFATTRLEVGTRVLAAFKEGQSKKTRNFPYYPGIVAEPPIASNNYRYLIFFDIGYSQYVPYQQVNLIYESSAKVWEDMSPDCQSFIKKYLESEDHPMIKTAKDQTVRTEYNGRWYLCTVMNVDCSLVQVFFEALNRMEWIYRGSTRLSPIFREEQAASNRQTGARPMQRKINLNESNTIVQYTRNTETAQTSPTPVTLTSTPPTTVRAVARKSTTRPQPNAAPQMTTVPFLPPKNDPPIANLAGPTSKIMYFTPRDQMITKRPYRPHICSPKCKDYLTHNFNKLRGHNPLSKPLLCGWARLTIKVRGKKEIMYKAPCGRMLRHMGDVHYYLTTTESEMTVDLFDFNQMVRCLAEFSVDCVPDPKDLSKGLEQVPISVINGINSEILDFWDYSIKRVPTEGVKMNLDPEFLCGCDCDDDCIDKSKCACWKLTLEGAKYVSKDVDPNNVGYIYRRLNDQVLTGIYECNSRCKCSSTCLNRVVQHPLSLKLQVFKTHNRGWGIRALNDVPQGAFICIYAGSIHTEQMANEDGKAYGDEYFAELDYIESVEKVKEDYESDVAMSDEEDVVPKKKSAPSEDEDDEKIEESRYTSGRKRHLYAEDNDFVPSNVDIGELENGVRRSLRRRQAEERGADSKSEEKPIVKKEAIEVLTGEINTVTISDDEDEGREVLSFNPKSGTDPDDKHSSKYVSVRELFGPDESVYVMDAKSSGNIGRFLNHSCSPNVFVQNVFVDTHDPRFPWVAFFSSQFIRAGTELVWNYNYDIGSVSGRVLYCYCASLECKGRLL